MRILFILPYDKTYKSSGAFNWAINYAPLTLSVLASLAPPHAEVKIVDEGVQKPYMDGFWDIVAISCVTSSARRAYELSAHWRKKGSHVILGGAHPTLRPEEAMEHADTVLAGFAEEAFPRFLEDFERRHAQKIYRHVCSGERLPMPVPRRDLLAARYMPIPTVVANRGCTNSCAYCCVHKMWGDKGLTRPIGEVVSELKGLRSKHFIFLDPSMSSDPEYAMELLSALAPLKIKWMGLSTIDVVKNAPLFELMIQSGCEGILAGFESMSDDSLNSVGKKTNTISEYKHAVKQFHDSGISVLGCFVAGFDGDTRESLLGTVDAIDEIGVDLPRFSILTPFPGTELFEKYEQEGRLLTLDWDMYDTMHVVFQPKNMTAGELQDTFHEMWDQAYKYKRIFKQIQSVKTNRWLRLLPALGFKFYARKLRTL